MKHKSKLELVIQFLKDNQERKFSAMQIAKAVFALYPEVFAEKRAKFGDDETAFLNQLRSEIGWSHLTSYHNVLKKEKDPKLKMTLFWYSGESEREGNNLNHHLEYAYQKLEKPETTVSLAVEFLQKAKGKKFTAREIAEEIYYQNLDFYSSRKEKYGSDKSVIDRMVGAIRKDEFERQNYADVIGTEKIEGSNKVLFWYGSDEKVEQTLKKVKETTPKYKVYSEYDLYPILIKYLNKEFNLLCLRIDEKTSSNTNGKNGNQWLHPDVVAMKAVDQNWDSSVKDCMKQSSSQNVELWSFEVKIKLESSNVRMSFFQAVSNSSWANEGYLVATHIADNVQEELRVLSALHGIGVILLDPNDLSQSKIILPARHRIDIDWQSVNRIVSVNKHFKEYIDYVSIYYKTGHIIEKNWNK